jgi:CDGSH-type Zn-finger protein
LCIHVGECGRAHGELFIGGRQPWCQPDLADTAEVVEVVGRCPTGALSYLRQDGESEQAADANTIVVSNNGPLYLRGELLIDGAADDMPGALFRAALCRCGQSGNKPFCDNSHESAGFVDRGAIGDAGPGLDESGGPLEVKRAKNGPLLVKGNVELVAASGRVAWRGTNTALCRCGASSNKPFCDGSHREAGFEAD